jgi:hypothetical protein
MNNKEESYNEIMNRLRRIASLKNSLQDPILEEAIALVCEDFLYKSKDYY